MIDMTYDPDADAVYIFLGRAEIDHQEEAGPFIYDVDAAGRVLGIEILSASEGPGPNPHRSVRAGSRDLRCYRFEKLFVEC